MWPIALDGYKLLQRNHVLKCTRAVIGKRAQVRHRRFHTHIDDPIERNFIHGQNLSILNVKLKPDNSFP